MARLTNLNRSIAGKVAVVTGAASGVGRSVAHLFADEGAKVGLIDRTSGGIHLVSNEIEDAGYPVVGQVADVTDKDAVNQAVQAIREGLGPIDILINNAG